MRKLFTLTLALLASFSLWAATVTMDCALSKGSTPSPSIGVALLNGGAFDGSGYKLGSDGNYIGWNISAANRTFSAITFNGYINTNSTDKNWGFQFSTDGGTTWGAEVTQANDGTKSYHDINVSVSIPSGANAVRIIRRAGTSSYVSSITLTLTPNCEAPENALVLNANKTSDIYAGDEITFSTTGGNGGAITIEGADSETITNNKWIATEGEHTFTASQAKNGNYCAQESELVLNVVAATPVAAVTVAGETNAYVGAELTYTATAANATAYEWYLDDVKQGSDSAKFIYTAVKGNHTIVCKARNQFNFNPYPEWVSSEAKELIVTNPSGTLISFTVNSNADGAASMSGTFASFATAKVALTKGSSQALEVDGVNYTGYKMDKGKYAGVTIPSVSGSFLAGDTISFCVTKASGTAKLYLYNDENGTNRLDSIAFSGLTGWATFVLNQATTGVYLYRSNPDVKPYDQNPYVAAVKIIRPKEVKSVTETLSNVKIDGEAISSANLTTLLTDESLDIAESYLNAPEVKFYKTIRTTYEDDSYTDKLDSIVVTAATEAEKWQAQATINAIEYTITMAKTPSYSVTYKLGSRTLGSELVIANGNPADYEDYQTIDNNGLSTFVGWYNNSDLTGEKETLSGVSIDKDTTFYAKFNINYASSINIEKWILDNGAGKGSSTKTDALIAEMNSHKYSTNIAWSNDSKEEIELDSLDDGKTSRNEPYLGLKVKKSGKLINFRLKEGDYVKVKFGQVSTTPKVAINGGDYEAMTITDGVYTYTATGEDLVSIYIDVAQKAVVYKQIMINEDIQDVTLPDTPTALDNTADEIKAVKFFENGQLFIRRGEKVYTITGEEVK